MGFNSAFTGLISTVKTNSTSCPSSVFVCFGWLSEHRATALIGFQARSQNLENYQLRYVCPSARLHSTTRLPLDGFSRKLIYFPNICGENSNFFQIDKKNKVLHKHTNIHFFFNYISFSSSYNEKCFKTHILCSIMFSQKNRAVYEIMWKNIVDPGRPQMTIWRMRIACWITNDCLNFMEYADSCRRSTDGCYLITGNMYYVLSCRVD